MIDSCGAHVVRFGLRYDGAEVDNEERRTEGACLPDAELAQKRLRATEDLLIVTVIQMVEEMLSFLAVARSSKGMNFSFVVVGSSEVPHRLSCIPGMTS
jgi:hypothetical protein